MKTILDTSGIKPEGNDNPGKIIREKGESLIYLPKNYTVIDIETTGFDPKHDKIIEVGAIKIKEGNIIDTFQSLVKPNGFYYLDNDGNETFNYIDDFITELTGITNEMLHNVPKIEDVLPGFLNFIKDDILLGHNVNFDINFLYDVSIDKLNYKLQNDFVDLLRLSRKIYPEFKNHKLKTVATNLEISTENNHRSLRDCEITYECFSQLSNHVIKNNIDLKSLFTRKNKSTKSIDLRTIEAEITDFDEDHPLYNKHCTFTGKLEKMQRKEVAQLVVNLGGKCLNSVTKKTNFLILGNFDYCSNIKNGKSSKLKRAEKLILDGQDLQILSENVFYDLVYND